MRDWAVDDVVALFTELKLTVHTAAVSEHEIDGRTLQELLAADGLGELGITSKLHVLRIKHALEKAEELAQAPAVRAPASVGDLRRSPPSAISERAFRCRRLYPCQCPCPWLPWAPLHR